MIVRIPVEFEVNSEEEGLDKQTAESAAEQAAFDYLSLVEISGYSTDTDEVEVHVDGHGKCQVRLTNDN